MKILKSTLLAAGMLLAGFGVAKAEGESASKPMKTEASLKAGLAEHIENFNLETFALSDETVTVDFIINKSGDVGIVGVSGENCVLTSYVEQKLKNKKIYVTEDLSDKLHTFTVRYVRL